MSDTPRTDTEEAMYSLSSVNSWGMGGWDFARTIERELSAVTRERDEFQRMAGANGLAGLEVGRESDALRAEVERLRAALSLYRFDKDMTGQYGAEAALQEPTP